MEYNCMADLYLNMLTSKICTSIRIYKQFSYQHLTKVLHAKQKNLSENLNQPNQALSQAHSISCHTIFL